MSRANAEREPFLDARFPSTVVGETGYWPPAIWTRTPLATPWCFQVATDGETTPPDREHVEVTTFGECTVTTGIDGTSLSWAGHPMTRPVNVEREDSPIVVPCPREWEHEAHFAMSAIVGGEPGPVPTIGYLCPGVTR